MVMNPCDVELASNLLTAILKVTAGNTSNLLTVTLKDISGNTSNLLTVILKDIVVTQEENFFSHWDENCSPSCRC